MKAGHTLAFAALCASLAAASPFPQISASPAPTAAAAVEKRQLQPDWTPMTIASFQEDIASAVSAYNSQLAEISQSPEQTRKGEELYSTQRAYASAAMAAADRGDSDALQQGLINVAGGGRAAYQLYSSIVASAGRTPIPEPSAIQIILDSGARNNRRPQTDTNVVTITSASTLTDANGNAFATSTLTTTGFGAASTYAVNGGTWVPPANSAAAAPAPGSHLSSMAAVGAVLVGALTVFLV